MILAGIVAFGVAALALRPVGHRLKAQHGVWTWVVGVVVVLIAAAVLWAGTAPGLSVLWGVGIGIGLGGLSGLRYGRGTLIDMLGRKR